MCNYKGTMVVVIDIQIYFCFFIFFNKIEIVKCNF
jgi:hypothetical protein